MPSDSVIIPNFGSKTLYIVRKTITDAKIRPYEESNKVKAAKE